MAAAVGAVSAALSPPPRQPAATTTSFVRTTVAADVAVSIIIFARAFEEVFITPPSSLSSPDFIGGRPEEAFT